jgi:hypothetical protein
MPVEIIQPQEGYVRILGVGPVAPLTEVSYTVSGGTSGTQPTFSGDPLFEGTYVKDGDLVHFRIDVDFDNITSFGTGQYFLSLPFVSKHNYQFADGCLHDISTGRNYPITGHVSAGSNELFLESLDAQGNAVFQVDFTSSAPVTLATADNFHVSGTYIMEEVG